MAGRFEGKQALVMGVANKRSIAWAIAQRLHAEGAKLAFTFQGERIEKTVRDLAASVDGVVVGECDVRSEDDLDRVFASTAEAFGGGLDHLVHSVAFAAAEDLEGRFIDTPRDRFWMAVDISAYSLVSAARRAEPLMQERGQGSILTMTYLGGVRAVPHYNVMGVAKATLDMSMRYLAWDLGKSDIRINAISAGPVRTLAARSIANFTTMEEMFEQRAPLHRQLDAEDCGAAAAYLLSGDGRNVTGTTLYVDAGYTPWACERPCRARALAQRRWNASSGAPGCSTDPVACHSSEPSSASSTGGLPRSPKHAVTGLTGQSTSRAGRFSPG